MIIEVALKNSNVDFDLPYLYKVPDELIVYPGTIVSVSFKFRKNEEAIVLGYKDSEDLNIKYEIKEINSVISTELTLNNEMIRLLNWMKKRYFCTYHDILKLMLPLSTPKRKKIMKTAYLDIDREIAIELLQTDELTNIKHIRIIENLIENEFIPVSELSAIVSASSSMFKTLEKKGYIRIEDRSYERVPDILTDDGSISDFIPELNEDQKKVVGDLIPKLGSFKEELIFGVTGSGKTEVYLRLIEETLKKGKNALILVPEIALTPQMVKILVGRFKEDIAVIHSRLSLGERFDTWKKIEEGKINVVVGARSAIFSPLENIGLIVIDEEHEFTYKSEMSPKYNAKDIARKRAIANDALLIYGSATPLIETYFKANDRDAIHTLPNKAASTQDTEMILVDMKEELKSGNMSVLSNILKREIKDTLDRDEKVMILLNRRGFNNIMICNDCQKVFECPNCSVSMKYHKDLDRMICHHCGSAISIRTCRYCGSEDLKGLGMGTQHIEEDLKELYPDVPIIRMDLDTQGIYKDGEGTMDIFKREGAAILIGTQLIAKGHDIEQVTLVGVLSADMVLSSDDFRASERTFSLISQVSGRAGRGRFKGKAIIQSFDTEDYSIIHATNNDYLSFYRDEIKIREMLGYPPFKTMAVIELRSKQKEDIDKIKDDIVKQLKEIVTGSEVIGPYDPYLKLLAGTHRVRILLKSNSLKELVSGLVKFDSRYGKKIRKAKIGLSIDVDPYQNIV